MLRRNCDVPGCQTQRAKLKVNLLTGAHQCGSFADCRIEVDEVIVDSIAELYIRVLVRHGQGTPMLCLPPERSRNDFPPLLSRVLQLLACTH